MKFALCILGALCFSQLACAQGPTEASITKCIADKQAASQHVSTQAGQNIQKQCLNGANFSPATKAVIDEIQTKAEYFNKLGKDLQNATNYSSKWLNLWLLYKAGMDLSQSISKFFNTANNGGDSISQCVKTQMEPVFAVVKDSLTCLTQFF